MMPNGGNMNPWMSHQWYNPAASLGSNQVQGMVDMNAFHMMASQQYGAGILPVGPVWNDASSQSQWMQQWQPNLHTKYNNINHYIRTFCHCHCCPCCCHHRCCRSVNSKNFCMKITPIRVILV
jgi:hypothetical protein